MHVSLKLPVHAPLRVPLPSERPGHVTATVDVTRVDVTIVVKSDVAAEEEMEVAMVETRAVEVLVVAMVVALVVGARVVAVPFTQAVPLHTRPAEQHSDDVQHVVPAGQHAACDRQVTLNGA